MIVMMISLVASAAAMQPPAATEPAPSAAVGHNPKRAGRNA
jgi:hypothetical protein